MKSHDKVTQEMLNKLDRSCFPDKYVLTLEILDEAFKILKEVELKERSTHIEDLWKSWCL